MLQDNPILWTDSYKWTHAQQYPDNTEYVYSYFEARTGAEYPFVEVFGIQPKVDAIANITITQAHIDEAAAVAAAHFGDDTIFNREGWDYILKTYGGKFPLEIRAVPEGLCVPINNVLLTVVNTDPKCFWLTNFVESYLTHIWYPMTVATKSKHLHNLLKMVGNQCCVPFIDFHVHDFGYRGTTGNEAAAIGAAAHLVNFRGTDTLLGIAFAVDHYQADYTQVGWSVPASEHSVATAEGKEGEEAYFLRMLRKYKNGIVSIVADSYDIRRFVEFFRKHKTEIIKRYLAGTSPINRIVIRPDSKRFKNDTPEDQVLWLHDQLWDIFGGEVKDGFKILHPAVGVIYGDGLSTDEIEDIYFTLVKNKYSISNAVVGQGGGLLQKLNRDTQRFAFKCSAQRRDGTWVDVIKDPLDSSKRSKAGRLKLVKHIAPDGTVLKVETINDRYPLYHDMPDILEQVYFNGIVRKRYTFEEVRANSLNTELYGTGRTA